MKIKGFIIGPLLIVLVLVLSACGPGQVFGPTVTPTPTNTSTPTSTSTPTITPSPIPTFTPIPTDTKVAFNFSLAIVELSDYLAGYGFTEDKDTESIYNSGPNVSITDSICYKSDRYSLVGTCWSLSAHSIIYMDNLPDPTTPVEIFQGFLAIMDPSGTASARVTSDIYQAGQTGIAAHDKWIIGNETIYLNEELNVFGYPFVTYEEDFFVSQ